MTPIELLAIPLGYFIGAFPSAYLIGRAWGKIDLRKQSDGHVSATALYREIGLPAFVLGLALDAGKGLLAIYLATRLTSSVPVLVATAYITVVGHCWPVYLKFNGGLGAVVTYAVIFALATREFLIGGAVAVILLFTTRKSSLATYMLIVVTSLVILIERSGELFTRESIIMVLFPLGMIPLQLIKRFQIRKNATQYKNELFSDLRRVKK